MRGGTTNDSTPSDNTLRWILVHTVFRGQLRGALEADPLYGPPDYTQKRWPYLQNCLADTAGKEIV